MNTFGERLRQLRKGAGLTQDQLASQVGVDKQTISQYELGKRRPSFDILQTICDFFNVSSDYILGNSEVTVRLVTSDELSSQSKTRRIPVLGEIAAGIPSEAITNIDEYEEVPDCWPGEYGALRVKGGSMLPLIREGDVVIFRRQDDAESEDLVIALIDGTETTVKKLVKGKGSITLCPLNPEYEPITFNNKQAKQRLQIIGRVVENRQKF